VDAGDEASQLVTVPVTGAAGRPRAMVVPRWYRLSVAMNLRLTDEETEALRRRAEQEGRSMQDVAREAIRQYTAGRQERFAAAIERIRTEDAELLDRLSK
jgi:predicted transcriptional regulator